MSNVYLHLHQLRFSQALDVAGNGYAGMISFCMNYMLLNQRQFTLKKIFYAYLFLTIKMNATMYYYTYLFNSFGNRDS